jgi:hypothetical protein
VTATGIHRNYECLINNTNKYPPTYSVTASPEWLDLGADNRWRMFDQRVGNVTSQVNTIVVELLPGRVINSVALFGLSGLSLRVQMTDPTDGLVYDSTITLQSSPYVIDFYTYLFSEFVIITEAVITDLPAYSAATLKLTITAPAATAAECGHVVIGSVISLGVALFGTSVGIIDYSRKEADDFGNPIIVQRKFAQTVDYDVKIESIRVRYVQRLLADMRTTPAVWIGSDIYQSTEVFGWFKDFSIQISNPAYSDCTISVEEFR